MITAQQHLRAVAAHLLTRRPAILKAWREAVKGDPALATAAALTRHKFNDHIPVVLDAFQCELQSGDPEMESNDDALRGGAQHGAHRWQEGYNVGEVTREWHHLHGCVLDELEAYGRDHAELESNVMPKVRRALLDLCGDGVSSSVSEYARLQQAAAGGRVTDLERALEQVNALQHQRAEVWREAAHDLRNSVGLVSNATVLLNHSAATDSIRSKSMNTLQTGVASLKSMLNDLLNLARLEAGQDQRQIAPLDAALLLSELCENTQPNALERGLFLRARGPASLHIEGDAAKIQRVAQNLLVNALQYTMRGGVTVSWALGDGKRWSLCIEDTGPGLELGAGPPILSELRAITADHDSVSDGKASAPDENANRAAETVTTLQPEHPSEGIGLSIVKQLCELLDASLEFESEPGKGSLFRVIFPL
ncbi:MAG: HAMP domain-containing sensor histidine kinase, partial [Betaproteobacteria bacterium]